MEKVKLGATLASAVAIAFVSSKASAGTSMAHGIDSQDKVKCLGGNECSTQGQCATENHSCAGLNECAGLGWVYMPQSECEEIPGATVAESGSTTT